MKPGDPTPRSPADVWCDRSYRVLESEVRGQVVTLTVFHCGTETIWQCEYAVYAAYRATEWWPAERIVVTKSVFRRVA